MQPLVAFSPSISQITCVNLPNAITVSRLFLTAGDYDTLALQWTIFLGAGLSLGLYIWASSQNTKVNHLVKNEQGRYEEADMPDVFPSNQATIVSVGGTEFFAEVPLLEEELPAKEGVKNAVVILRIRGRDNATSTGLTFVKHYAQELKAESTRRLIAGGVAILAGMAIFPIVFAYGLEPGAGPGLIFRTLPIAFGHMPGGTMVGVLFFTLLVFAAWTSAISLIEPAVAYLVENKGLSRIYASVWIGAFTWFVGLGTVLSFNLWKDKTLTIPYVFEDLTFFDTLDYLTANIMLPLGGLFIALFAGWVMRKESTSEEIDTHPIIFKIWRFLVRFITPVAVIVVFLKAVGAI